jgi:hypothetical protein
MTFTEQLHEHPRPLSYQIARAVGSTALEPSHLRRAERDSSAEEARQALQESLDLREQGHVDD